MKIVLPALAVVGFAAFCIWLTVQIANRHERWARWAAVVMVLFVAYSLSHGPALGILVKVGQPRWLMMTYVTVYKPLYWALALGPEWLFEAAVKYRFWWMDITRV